MKKFITTIAMLITVISMTVAQSPAMMTKVDNTSATQTDSSLCQENRLDVEIISTVGGHFDHPQHPANGIECPFILRFTTAVTYSTYYWETSLPSAETWDNNILRVNVYHSGYIKVTVWDNSGNVGSDSIWFNVRSNEVPPMENFIMEIDDDLHAEFSGIVSEDHRRIIIDRGFIPGQFIHSENLLLSPGIWNYKDTDAIYSDDSLWIYDILILDPCQSGISYLVPGVLLGTYERCLTIKSILQDEVAPMFYSTFNFRYCIYTVDEDGNRHEFMDNYGNPIILQPETTSWPLQGPHIDPYYQVGVGRQLEDGSYELLSLSNKVPNPWPDTDGINEGEEESFAIFPNPANGQFTVIGTGILTICNISGQTILQKEIDGEFSIELPAGVYVSKLSTKNNNYYKKIVVY